jgi:hypothetical protein
MTMTRTASAIAVLVLLVTGRAPSHAQAPPAPGPASSAALPTADRILERYEQSLGGAAALAKVQTRIVHSRRFQDIGPPEDHYLVRTSQRPSLSIMKHVSLDNQFLFWLNGCDGTTGWQRTDKGDIQNSPTSTGGICQNRLAYYGYFVFDLAMMKRAFERFEVKGIHKIFQPEAGPMGSIAGGKGPELVPAGSARDAYLVLGIPARKNDGYEWLYFDTQTGVLLRFADAGTGATPAPAGTTARIVDYIQYRAVGDGTRMPFQFVTQTPTTRVRAVHMSVEENAALADGTFTKPRSATREDKGL